MKNLFEYATRNQIRFVSNRGQLSVEQLWEVPLRSKDSFNLDAVAKLANHTLKELTEESFVQTTPSPGHLKAEAALEIIKHVIDVKLSEEEKSVKRAENKAEREKLLQILSEKQDGKLSNLSETELRKRIEALS